MKIDFTFPSIYFKEKDQFVAYAPTLDLSTAASSQEKAKKMLSQAVEIFFEELIESGNLEEVLIELGWQKINNRFMPPEFVSQSIDKFTFAT